MRNNKPNNKEEQKKGASKKSRAPEVFKDVNEKWSALRRHKVGPEPSPNSKST